MHIRGARLNKFKRFTDLTIRDLPETAKLVVLTGPNGSGKSAIFEAFNFWRRRNARFSEPRDPDYFPKKTATGSAAHTVDVTFFEEAPTDLDAKRRLFYIRSPYRHEPDFQAKAIRHQPSYGEQAGPEKLILNENRVHENYERLVALVVREVFDSEGDPAATRADLRDMFIGKLRVAMSEVFGGLVLDSPGDPIEDGTFFFTKGVAPGFHYKNLSGGEKAGFDLLLDFVVRAEYYTQTVYCIDEPELHMGSAVQARLLQSLTKLLPDGCQLWIATHSLGMMREALRMYEDDPKGVGFLDTYGLDFDEPQVLTPRAPTRKFWKQVLSVALDDMASLVSPEIVFLCESDNDFDSAVYSAIFHTTKPWVEFISVGNSSEVLQGGGGAQRAIGVVAPGTRVLNLVDRDDKTEEEVVRLRSKGVRVLSLRNIESYLFSDEILKKLATSQGKPELGDDLTAERDNALSEANAQKHVPTDDFKKAGSAIRTFARSKLGMSRAGSNVDEFKRNIVAPLVTPDTQTYEHLETDLFSD